MAFGNPGFEDPTPAPWVLGGSAAVRDDLVPHAGAQCLFLWAQYSSFGPIIAQSTCHQHDIPATIGNPKTLYFWVNADGGGLRPTLRVFVDPAGGSNFTTLVFSKKKADLPSGWTFVACTAFVPLATKVSASFELRQDWGPINGSGFFLVDDASDVIIHEPEDVLRKRTAYENLTTLLKSIAGSGAGCYTDLGNRVYPVLALPEIYPEITSPYVCIAHIETGSYGDAEMTPYERKWTAQIHGFVREKASNRMASTIIGELSDLEDDILQALWGNQTLSQAVTLIRPVSQRTASGLTPQDDYGELVMVVEFTQYVSPEVLGPS